MTSRDKQGIRLNRFIAMCGISSRRKADLLIQQGLIKINNEVITNLGQRVKHWSDLSVTANQIKTCQQIPKRPR